MRRAAAILLALAMWSAAHAQYPGYSDGYTRPTGYASATLSAAPDTFRIWSRNTAFPNTAAKDAGYITAADTVGATINSALAQSNVVQAIRYCEVNKQDPTNVQVANAWDGYRLLSTGTATEDNFTWSAGQRIAFVWASTNGMGLAKGSNSVHLLINADAFGFTVGAGSYIAARIDTVSADYRITVGSSVGHGSSNDYARMGASWNEVDDSLDLAWSPALDSRNDWHDFGPRSNNVIGPGTYARGTCFDLDLTDGFQQVLDNGTVSRGVLVVIYSVGNTTTWGFSAGMNATFVGRTADGTGYGKGDPTFIAEATNSRGAQRWRGERVPVSFQADDSYNVQVGYHRALETFGLQFSAAACSSNVYARPWPDSLYAVKPASFYVINHSRSHGSLGALTAGQLAFNMNRTWFPQHFAGIDTAAIVDYALPGGGGVDENANVAAALVANGYRSMRSGGFEWNVTTQGPGYEHDTRLAWDGYVSKYQIHSLNARYIFGANNNTQEADTNAIKEALTDLIDRYYTDYGHAALVLYAHWYTQSTPYDWTSEDNLRYFFGLVRRLNSCGMVNYGDLLNQRFAGAVPLTPSQVNAAARAGLVATADSAAIRKSSAHQDSLVTRVGGYDSLKRGWLGPWSADTGRFAAATQSRARMIPGSIAVVDASFAAACTASVKFYDVTDPNNPVSIDGTKTIAYDGAPANSGTVEVADGVVVRATYTTTTTVPGFKPVTEETVLWEVTMHGGGGDTTTLLPDFPYQ